MTDKHLLWWVFKAIEDVGGYGATRGHLLSAETWAGLNAPDWVLPALREKYEHFDQAR